MAEGSEAVDTALRNLARSRDVGGQVDERLREVAQRASDAESEIRVTGAAVEDQIVAPWHRDVAKARTRYLDHSQAWVREMGDAARDPVAWLERPSSSEIEATFDIAHRAYRDALPWPPLTDHRERVEAIYAQ